MTINEIWVRLYREGTCLDFWLQLSRIGLEISQRRVKEDNRNQPADLGPTKSLQESQASIAPSSKFKIRVEDVLTRLTIAELFYKLGEYAEAKRQFEKFLISLHNSEINPGFMRKLKEEAHRYLVELNLINP